VSVDLAGRSAGRGAWVHPRPECITRAVPRGLSRAFRSPHSVTASDLLDVVKAAARRRVVALIGSARASGKLAIGTEATLERAEARRAELVIVARDARAAKDAVMPHAGRSVVWGDKTELGAAVGRATAGVVAVLDRGLANAIARAVALSTIEPPSAHTGAGGVHVFPEVR
jgi:ribosomal protein L7Ae-like RNA K-turn-binding protein